MSSVPQGVHNAICVGIIYLGSHIYNNGSVKRVALLWEIHSNNRVTKMSREYSLSFSTNSTLRKHLESWRGRAFTDTEIKEFNVKKILGVPCQVDIAKNNGQKFVCNVYPYPKNSEKITASEKCFVFDMTDESTYSCISSIPGYLISKIKHSVEYPTTEFESVLKEFYPEAEEETFNTFW